MQAAFDITAKHCHKEMEAFGSCVASYPSSWQQTCHELKMKVAHCTSSHPVIRKIRQGCSQEFVDFEKCLSENQDSPTSCSPHMARFAACAETLDLSQIGKLFSEGFFLLLPEPFMLLVLDKRSKRSKRSTS
uniref:IMS import disulfide relay-system CHCH-CHCH-like Cx9C domain-containing protein n=1 Tax=Neogobius melanostomus TaxID=47308 RepID=A0A8C6TBH9_9GOBI